MNILHVISSRGWGGAENAAAYLAKAQIEHGHKAFFFIHSGNKKIKSILDVNGIPYFSSFDPERKNVFAIKKLIRICAGQKIEIIHTHLGTGCYLGVIAGNRLKIPVISSILIFSGFPYYGMADSLFFCSGEAKDFFSRYFSGPVYSSYKPPLLERLINNSFGLAYRTIPAGEILAGSPIVYLGINESMFIGYKDKVPGFENFFNIGMTGRVTEQKGQRYFVEAAEMLLKENRPVNAPRPLMFHIVGSGDEEDKLKKLAKTRAIENSFKFWGYRADVRPFVNTFDVAVSCSLNEPLGINNLEYMFMKKPCVAAASGGIPEIYGDTNILVPPKDPLKLKQALKKYIGDPALMAKEAEKGFLRARAVFGGAKIYAKTMKEYDKTLAGYSCNLK